MALNGKKKAGPAEARTYLKYMIDENYSVFPSFSPEDEKQLVEMLPEQAVPNMRYLLLFYFVLYLSKFRLTP